MDTQDKRIVYPSFPYKNKSTTKRKISSGLVKKNSLNSSLTGRLISTGRTRTRSGSTVGAGKEDTSWLKRLNPPLDSGLYLYTIGVVIVKIGDSLHTYLVFPR